ncbi:DUF3244 domain-containing protein [Dysgonomonas termitidis]|jgi:hypothetical protein|uniref:DUF3244 domain-containing protein n=1 Tax=Dysgonomonas termitidis TaxID=1516126 RepID=A0ABV9L534_9BACT
MRIKTLFLVFLIFCYGGTGYAATDENVDVALHNAGGPGQGEPIMPLARMITVSPVTVTVTDNVNMDISFRTNLGVVNVIIKDEAGMVHYMKNVNASKSVNLSVDISILPSGTYTVSLENAGGTLKKYGTFEVN